MQKNRIKNTAQEILKKEGVKQKVNVHFVQEKFPEKNYGQYTFPEGIYDAVRIDLGAAKGHNWWCVMFPDLCVTKDDKVRINNTARKKMEKLLGKKTIRKIITCSCISAATNHKHHQKQKAKDTSALVFLLMPFLFLHRLFIHIIHRNIYNRTRSCRLMSRRMRSLFVYFFCFIIRLGASRCLGKIERMEKRRVRKKVKFSWAAYP